MLLSLVAVSAAYTIIDLASAIRERIKRRLDRRA